MDFTFQTKYIDILRKQRDEGLEFLSKMSIKDKDYERVVVNINNANNISYQLEHEIMNFESQKNQVAPIQEENK